MSLNIKNEDTHRLAKELAELTGETMTTAITTAIQQRLERERHDRGAEARLRRLRALRQRCALLLIDGPSATEHGDFLYGEDGLPR